jgi:competence protein ComEC
LVLGIAAAIGAASAQPSVSLRWFLLAAGAAWCAVRPSADGEGWRIRALAATALALGAVLGHIHHAEAAPVRAHTLRLACTVLDAQTCLDDDGRRIAVDVQADLPEAGARVVLRGRIEPFDAPRNPGEPDQREIEAERGLTARMENAHVLRRLQALPSSMLTGIAVAHAWALAQLHARLGEPYASIVAGELWGERASMPPELRAEFAQTGTVHVLVTAGLHLGVVALSVLSLLRFLTVPRIGACALTAGCVWAYAIFSGMHLPSVRAASMISFALAARAAGAAPVSWNAYGAALLVIALFWPQTIGGASFALSFSCVGAILLCASTIARALEDVALPERLREAVTLTIATQLGTWPLTAAIFLQYSPYAVVANLLVVPAVAATMLLAAAQLAAAPFAPLAQAIANANSWILAWIVAAVHGVATLPGATIPATPPAGWTIAGYDAALVAAVSLWKRSRRRAVVLMLSAASLLAICSPSWPDHRLRVTVLDVGQADGIVIQTPQGHTIVVDAGGKLERGTTGGASAEEAGERVLVPFLRRSGVHRIDALILSHPHGDHAGAMAPIMRDGFDVGELADSGQQYSGYAWCDAIATARADRVPIVYPRAGMVWRTDDGVTLTFIGPSLPFIESNNTINDNSIAFILQYKQFRMLFTGDAGVAAEQRFLDEGIDLHADVRLWLLIVVRACLR